MSENEPIKFLSVFGLGIKPSPDPVPSLSAGASDAQIENVLFHVADGLERQTMTRHEAAYLVWKVRRVLQDRDRGVS